MLTRQKLERRWKELFDEQNTWKPTWQDLARYILPRRGFFLTDSPNRGERKDNFIIDGTPIRAARVLAAGMMSGLTSPSRPWFKLGVADPDLSKFAPVRFWLDEVQNRMMAVYSMSNIYNALHSVYEEVGAFGTAAMIVLEDFDDIIRGRTFTIGEYALGTGPDLRVNALARQLWMTVAQLVQEFGIDNVSLGVKNAWENNQLGRWVNVYHLIEPNDDRIHDLKDARNKPFRSVYWEAGTSEEKYLRVSGFDEFPVMAPRWDIVGADIYGKGPGWDALGDSKQLQKMQEDKLMALDKLVNPPMTAPASVLRAGGVNLLPGGVTFHDETMSHVGVKPTYQINPDLQGITLAIQEVQQAIRETFFSDLFLMLAQSDRRQMTAREVAERHEEKLLMLGPVLERLESELLDPLIDRTFSIMNRNGLIPPPPRELQGMYLKVEYISVLAQAQKMVGTTSIERMLVFAQSVAAAKPDVLDKIDFDEAIDQYADMLGVPPGVIVSDDQVAKIRQARAEQQAQMQAAQYAMAAVQGAKTLSDTSLEGKNALAMLTGMGDT